LFPHAVFPRARRREDACAFSQIEPAKPLIAFRRQTHQFLCVTANTRARHHAGDTNMTPIQLYTYQTPNGHKASIMIEETGLPYQVHVVDIDKGDQYRAEFLALSPNNKIPVIVDPERKRTVFESGAILFYLAERSGVLKPDGPEETIRTLQWTLFQAAHVGPMLGQLWHFKVFAKEKLPYAIERYEREADRILRVLDVELGKRPYLAGDRYGIADIMTWAWINALPKLGRTLEATPTLQRWHAKIAARPAVKRGLAVPALPERDAAA
jgi:GSH-dependent disulfide-bond oxidoreductase